MWQKIWHSKYKGLTLVFLAAVAARFYGILTPAQPYDMGTFHSWAITMAKVGPVHFFPSTWSDYLPLPLYSFTPVLWLSSFTHLSFDLTFKLTTSLVELILIYVILHVSKKSLPYSLLSISLLLLSSALIGDTAFWGQVDTIPALMTLLSLVLVSIQDRKAPTILDRETFFSSVLFGLSVAYKPIMLITLPVFFVLLLRPRHLLFTLSYLLVSFIAFLATAVPMTDSLNPISSFMLLFTRSLSQSSTYPYTTINAWNLWSVVPHPTSWPPDNQIALGLSAHTFGLAIFIILTLLTLNHWRRAKWDRKFGFRVAGTLLVLFFTFTTRMHERHLLFGLPLLAVATGIEPWLAVPTILLTATFTTNLWAAFYWVNHAQTWPAGDWLPLVVSWANVVTSLGLAMVWHWPRFIRKVFAWVKKNQVLVAILVLAAFLRFYHLAYPSAYIFDEVYHSFTAREYLHNRKEAWEWWTTPPKGVAYEWTHPPVAKYGMVGGMLLFGENSFGWRVGSAVAGVISIYGLYLLVLTLTKNRLAALLSAFLVSIEGLHLSQSRIGMNDMYMLAFLVWSLYQAAKSRWKWSAVLFGLSLASKWSAVYGFIPLGIIYLHQHFPIKSFHDLRPTIYDLLRLPLIAILIYILAFTPFFVIGHTWGQWWELQRQMWYYHTHLKATHAYQSIPVQWLFDIRPVWYYVNYGKDLVSNIYAQGNPAILWLGLVAFVMSLPRLRQHPNLLLTASYLIFTVPWMFSPRIMFFYHYLPSAFFLCALLGLWLSSVPRRLMFYVLVLCSLCFVLLIPVYYGTGMPHWYWDSLFTLMPSWK